METVVVKKTNMAELRSVRRVVQRSLRRQRVFLDRQNPLENLRDDTDVRARFRFHRTTIYTIYGEIREYLQRPTHRSHSLPAMLVLLVALRYFAGGSFYMLLGDYVNISRASAQRCVFAVANGLRSISDQYIKFPSKNAMNKIKEDFYDIAGV